MATSKNSTFRINKRLFFETFALLSSLMLLPLKLLMHRIALYLLNRNVAFFLPKSFHSFFNRIACYAQSKESKNLSSNIDEVSIPQTTYKAIFRNCLNR